MTTDRDRTVRLPDGRTLGYAEYGAAAGLPVFVFHGMPGSRLDLALPGVDDALRARSLRGLVVERPGIGRSTPSPRRRLLDWPADVEAFADAVGVDRFAVLGLSAGAPYALACARSCPGRILAAGVVAPPAPPGIPGSARLLSPATHRTHRLARWLPGLLKGATRTLGGRLAAPQVAPDQLMPGLAEADREALAEPDTGAAWLATWREAFRQGPDGPWWDRVATLRPWGFAPAEIAIPVQLWFGQEDRHAPPHMGRYLANALQRSEARLYSRDGHYSIVTRRIAEILDGVATRAGRARQPS